MINLFLTPIYSTDMNKNRDKQLEQIKEWHNGHHTIRIANDEYAFIKAWCDAHGIHLTKWLIILAKEAIQHTDVSKMKPAKKNKGE